jgi:hypothetical protein
MINQIFTGNTLNKFCGKKPGGRRAAILVWLIILSAAAVAITGCSGRAPATPEEQIRTYIYENQPVAEAEFVRWAGRNLSNYSSRRIHDAIYNEGKYQAEMGHPTATNVLQNLAKQWARANGFSYDPAAWRNIQEEAVANLQQSPTLRQLWPAK